MNKIPILIGSQTGTGLQLAQILKTQIEDVFIVSIDSFNILKINDFKTIIFIVSTHGDGQCPFNMSKFYRIITETTKNIFSFEFYMLGLGDSSYVKFNHCSKITATRIKKLGGVLKAIEFCDTQDQNGVYDGFNRFLKKIQIESFNEDHQNSVNNGFLKKIQIESINEDREEININEYLIDKKSIEVKVISNRLITTEKYKSKIYELILEMIENNNISNNFKPGACIAIMALSPSSQIKICNPNLTKEEKNVLMKCLDCYSIVHQNNFKKLSEFTNNSMHKSKLIEIYNDYDLFYDYVQVPRRNIGEIAKDFELSIPFDFLRTLNPILPRFYSCTKSNNQYKIIYNEVKFDTYLKNRKGLCSEYLKTINPGDILEIELNPSNLFLEAKKLLFFCTGTGVTLPRSAVHYFKDKVIRIYYGFRYFNSDCLCRDEFNDYFSRSTDPEEKIFYTASRDENKYIMDKYKEEPVTNIDDWLVFVSGNCRLNKEIRNLLFQVHGKHVIFQSETW